MPETSDLLAALRDVGVTTPLAGDRGDARVRSGLQREIAGRRRTPRARPRRRTVLRGAAIAAAVAVAGGVVLATGAVDGPRRPGPRAPAGATTQARDTAYIVGRVRAHLARLAVAGQGQVLEKTGTIGDGTAGNPIVHNTDWAYIDPRSGVAYQRSVDRSANGTVVAIDELVTTPIRGVLHTRVTFLDPSRHTYLVDGDDAPPGGSVRSATSGTQLGIKSTARQISQALRGGTVTREGDATVDGQPTIKLSVPPAPRLVAAGLPRHTTITLYVNSRTYAPVQEVETAPHVAGRSAGDGSTSRWLPTTAGTIALTRARVPTRYTRRSGPLREFWTGAKPLFFIGY